MADKPAAATQLLVNRGGMCASIQDLGRPGFLSVGVCRGGAMDREALAAANILVGNDRHAPAIEVTLYGSEFTFSKQVLIAMTGADLQPTAAGQPIPLSRPVCIAAGARIEFRPGRRGSYLYLAVAGGFDVPLVLRGRGTHLAAGFGGFRGRALRAGDQVNVGWLGNTSWGILQTLARDAKDPPVRSVPFHFPDCDLSTQTKTVVARVLPGIHASRLTDESVARLHSEPFFVSQLSNRLGYRLQGPRLELSESREIRSVATVPGTIQLPPGGSPIVLMADAAPTGGYPQIGYVVQADLRVIAQSQPGTEIRLIPASLAEARSAARASESALQKLQMGLRIRYGR